ncbi:DNA gyrase subunit A [Candidatus Pelagibacter communis]|mgnify:FL=1|jgi:DNA gyrase subunit A|uniref:DNA gyrase subunit A n=1 Tax=Pelagibacter ubique (strain HTCC1062) TaxID=335992 RepID=Q4FLZ5_PELUB|nr:DNA gyrase subunit A [Candidatus Pelagibacter ubique]AAZ21793.1 DNA gyrase subunit A [Candidatus Pelagibacter ubique HTCC1062]MDA7462241.1 DNA gyrase subunit A [Candidatus Pelagibacter ubique]MDA9972740.1 DNA gyrase subunit A [Candidatus Pelagibacter ubique]MDC1044038.1 DNA gyrase subunit A [Candidatus Pelagibacter ubique]MDC6473557.1 DNA gyrase subunit A [Candidatus Pelagibacter ubique]
MKDTEIPKDKNIKLISMHDEMSSSYLSYAMSVIVSRALPDVRDGLKPVHRRILFAMYKGGYDWSKQFRKSARIVGDVIGKYHPHGDQSVYDALVRMVQDFSMSLPLVQGQGNFGSIDGDPAAAMRYTETRLAKVSQYLIDDIEKDTIEYKSNYDETEKEPSVLPAQYPNLLVNGAGGIAVGMATSIPPHNLGEIIDGTLALIENKDIKIKELMKHIPGPDFPTGGVIIGKEIIKAGYNVGRGSFKIRGEISVEAQKNGRERLVITSVPYQVNKSVLNERIAQLVREKKIEGIKDIRDESNREGIRVAIDLRNGVEPETIKRLLYKNTSIESSFGFNTLAIVDGKPKICNLKEFLTNFLTFREDVVIKKTKFDLKKAEDRAHILIGLSVSVENLDKIIKIIRSSKTPDDAKKSLLNTKWKINKSLKLISLVEDKKEKNLYSLSDPQVIAILELRLQKLTALGINEIEVEIKKLADLIKGYKKIINSKKELLNVISEELKTIKEKFAVPRRTKIIDAILNYDIEETIQKESVIITVTLQGYIKRGALSSVKQQKRGGKGKSGITTRDEDSVVQTLSVNTHTSVLFFSTEGLVYKIKAWKIPEGSTTSKGKSLFNILPLKNHQSISSIMPFPDEESDTKNLQIVFATAKGKVRKNSLEDFSSINSAGKIAIKLDPNDKIVGVEICKDDQDVMLSTKNGKCIRFESKKLRIFKGRSSKGIKGIELSPNDEIVSLSITNKEKIKKDTKSDGRFVLSITENGYGKKTLNNEYRVTNRGGKGIIGIVNSPRNGSICSSFPVIEGDDVMISTNKGRVIRVAVKEIRTAGRNTQGVRIIKLSGDEKVVSAIKIDDNLE